jgi:hypothetical protein
MSGYAAERLRLSLAPVSEDEMRDCSIQLTNHPGDLARVAEALARRGVNIKALAAMSIGGSAMARILPDDIVVARSAFESANVRFTESEVHLVLLENRAGVLAEVANRLGEAGINLDAIYVTGIADGLVELAVVGDNPKKTKKILEEF